MINIYRNLAEAYQQVYTPQEIDEATAMAKRGYDETKLRQRAGGGEAADRATSLENRPTYGDKNKESQRSNYARAQRGDFRKTSSSNPGLHVGQHKSNDPAVKAKQAARGAQRGALTPNERKQLNMGDESFDVFDLVLEFLQVEGYAETLEEAEWMMANIIDEEAIDIILGEEQLDEISKELSGRVVNARIAKTGRAFDKEMKDRTPENMRATVDAADKETRAKRLAAGVRTRRNATNEEYMDEAEIMRHQKERDRIEGNKAREAKRVKNARSAYGKKQMYSPPTKGVHGEIERRQAQRPPSRLRSGSLPEEYMDEAQEARNNPEKYEREQSKKTAPVRGERTPMPPRGDKRREDFEKWYAKNVR